MPHNVPREADAFIGLPSVYVSAIVNGLWQAVRDGVILDWDPCCGWQPGRTGRPR